MASACVLGTTLVVVTRVAFGCDVGGDVVGTDMLCSDDLLMVLSALIIFISV